MLSLKEVLKKHTIVIEDPLLRKGFTIVPNLLFVFADHSAAVGILPREEHRPIRAAHRVVARRLGEDDRFGSESVQVGRDDWLLAEKPHRRSPCSKGS